MEIEKSVFFNLMHYEYGEAFFGSHKGMRFRLARDPLDNVKFVPVDKREPATLMATVWPEPYSYAKTDKKLMIFISIRKSLPSWQLQGNSQPKYLKHHKPKKAQ